MIKQLLPFDVKPEVKPMTLKASEVYFDKPGLDKPRSQTAEVLYELLQNKETTRRDFFNRTGVLSVTSRITELRQLGLNIVCRNLKTKNKFGRAISFGSWSLPADEREKAEQIYKSINQ